MCAARSGRPAGMPSSTLTRACPCDSPAVVKRSMTMKAASGGKDASPARRRARFSATYHAISATSWPGEDVRRGDVDHNEPLTRHTEELEHHRGIVAREGQRGAEWSIEVVLRRQRAALVVVVRDVDHLDRSVGRGHEGQSVDRRRARAVGVRMEGDAGTLREGALLPLPSL